MYTMRLVVHPILADMHLSGTLLEQQPDGEYVALATWSETVPISDWALSEDPVATMINVVREWSIRTIHN